MERIEIIDFDATFVYRYKELNTAWLQKYFYVEPIDEEMLGQPKENILDKGGFIFFAKMDNEIAGTVALLQNNKDEYEIGKMAVDERHQGQKIGHLLMERCIEKCKELGVKKVILYSNTILKPAIHLYQKFGFREVPIINSEYKRSNIKMEKNIA
jgi:ribosomal protein S18 acetylase RimI-like enzyme